ncbi:restriction endonuclease subunit R [Nostoc sp. UCD121]|uniref:restriction endonuclease subunit R n=1 Tax=unclassified Nostoc TaxID=2593658 RepID=UPI0016291A8E|nr:MULTISPECIES: restriction endonuclease subunit R [unclassified Nostoc]MBC1223699.1 restriction endonuclease subunit R [Nostoc sp. UCD120]MBC1278122.1 restriction endonuclease subunit R [Nostoc sp. UCD121]MBC1295414.1 restriction endonuclease subunit R [Nostoc sp. UCD122]
MTLTVEASSLSLNDVHRLLKLDKLSNASFTDFLRLETLSDFEQQDLLRIRDDFDRYLSAGKISEGLVKFLTIAPLMRLAGFYDVPIRLTMEDSIAIAVEDEDRRITGRMDILAINSPQSNIAPPFWVLVIETKNSSVNVIEGLPQLLTYAFKSLDQQPSVWGLVTNGQLYQFVYLRHDNQSTYELMPLLNLSQSPDAIELLQVFKAICKLPSFQ